MAVSASIPISKASLKQVMHRLFELANEQGLTVSALLQQESDEIGKRDPIDDYGVGAIPPSQPKSIAEMREAHLKLSQKRAPLSEEFLREVTRRHGR